ncbi:MAG: permease [Anaerolineae bacterium]|nr:permease [Anaerolineae bacterium]
MPANPASLLILAAALAWGQVVQLAPYVAAGILLAALLGQCDLPRRWGHWLSRSGPGTVVGATCLGSVSPLCTYGTVPMLIELLHKGASPGPALAFLIASTLLNPQLFIMMAGGLGLPLALAHAASVLLLSAPIGLLTQRLRREAFLKKGVLPDPLSPSPCPSGARIRGLLPTLLHLTETIGLTFVISVILAALLQTLIPREWISSLLGAGRWYGVLLAGVLGVPFYACGGGAVPLIAGLMAQGMSPGAALAFFLAGPATRLTSLAALGTLLNRRALAVYVAYVVAGAALAGLVLNLVMGA